MMKELNTNGKQQESDTSCQVLKYWTCDLVGGTGKSSLPLRPCLLPRSRSLDMAGMGDSGKKKRGGKMFGSLERGLDKVITMLTPSKRRDGPRKIKVCANTLSCHLFCGAHTAFLISVYVFL